MMGERQDSLDGLDTKDKQAMNHERMRISLSERTQKAYDLRVMEDAKKNRDRRAQLRQDITEIYAEVSDKMTSHDAKVITRAYSGEMERRLESKSDLNDPSIAADERFLLDQRKAMRGRPVQEAIEWTDDVECNYRKRLNKLCWYTQEKEKMIDELKNIHRRSEEADELEEKEDTMGRAGRDVENRLNKTKMKHDVAYTLAKMYKKILDEVKIQLRYFPDRIRNEEAELKHQSDEIDKLRKLHTKSNRSRNGAQRRLQAAETSSKEQRETRLSRLETVKKKVEQQQREWQRQEEATRSGSKDMLGIGMARTHSKHDVMKSTGSLVSPTSKSSKDNENSQDETDAAGLEHYQLVFGLLKQVTNVQTREQLIEQIEMSKTAANRLKCFQKQLHRDQMDLHKQRYFVQRILNTLKYEPSVPDLEVMAQLQLREIGLKRERTRAANLANELQKSAQLLVSVKAGLAHINDQLRPALMPAKSSIELPEPIDMNTMVNPRLTADSLGHEQLRLAEEKILQLYGLLNISVDEDLHISNSMRHLEFNLYMSAPKFDSDMQDFKKRCRISFSDDERRTSLLPTEDIDKTLDNEDYKSREAIKKSNATLISQKAGKPVQQKTLKSPTRCGQKTRRHMPFKVVDQRRKPVSK